MVPKGAAQETTGKWVWKLTVTVQQSTYGGMSTGLEDVRIWGNPTAPHGWKWLGQSSILATCVPA